MNAQLQTLLDRVDALSLRERLILCFSVLVCALALADFVWFTPAQAAHKLVLQRFAAQGAELDRLRGELALATLPGGAGPAARAELQALDSRMAALDAEVATLTPVDAKGPPLEGVLQRLLRHQQGLTLVSLDTQQAEATPTENAAAHMPPGLSRHGLTLRVSGPYAELVRYVQALETALPGLRWGPMELKADRRSTELSLQMVTLGSQP